MPRHPHTPPELAGRAFRGSAAVDSGLLTRGMLAGPSWSRIFPDVYVHRDHQLDHRDWCAAATLTIPAGAVIGGPSAASLWGAVTPAHTTPVHVAAPRAIRLRRDPRIAVHYTSLRPGDVTTHHGLALTTVERTAFDVGRRAGRADALVVLDALLHRHLLDPDALRRMISRRVNWPGTSRLGALLALADARSESPMETCLRLLLVDAGVPPGAVQFEVRQASGWLVGRVDLAWPEVRLAVEYDGDQHRSAEQFRRDVERLNALRMAGWTVLRFTAEDVLRQRLKTVRLVTAALAELEPLRGRG
ncbi:hypothetical protein AMIS_7220 [Actinoplanes missouriensis 431]|uniref:DUF559 domain-containing protein n=1 Tax=Actinoplanes missouriensis (strain ATCC 14538 / DSM 43046 / CBS 188.64 / JCM 3121 / NBRC 102363 / NCIMB 12654 / NRRL B-3342 / UNCC 431) TaxID=512565 RepID=I0GYV5_ACTM4|nr:DUF559 domain-containing protein [Actinoplanes missouriensis]BAL85942.1 hypothetical protein AMIS_7220 [Actinoplanes missouriensis 431]